MVCNPKAAPELAGYTSSSMASKAAPRRAAAGSWEDAMKRNSLLGAVVMAGAAFCLGARAAPAPAPDRMAALEAKVDELQAKDEIRELFNRYGFTADTGDAKGWSEVWAKDAVYDGAGGRIVGREAFFHSIEDPNGVHKREIEGKGSLHTTGALTIRVTGDTAWAEGATLVWVRNDAGGYRPFTLSYNHWDLRRADGRWEIVHRLSRPVAPGNAPQVFTAWRETR
jgi:ketosteroid isomerase-like protein